MSSIDQMVVDPPSLTDLPSDHMPGDFYERIRAKGDIAWDEQADSWVVSSYDLVRAVLAKDDRDWKKRDLWDDEFPPCGATLEQWSAIKIGGLNQVGQVTGEDHDREHRWWFRILSPKVLTRWNDRLIEPVAQNWLDGIAERGRADLYSDYCSPVTWRVAAAQTGLPYEDEEWFARLHELRQATLAVEVYVRRTPPRELVERAAKAGEQIAAMLQKLVLEQRDQGIDGDDFISLIWRDAESVWGQDYSEVEVAQATFAFFSGSMVTGATTAGNGLYLILTNPQLQEEVLAGGPTALSNFAEETLRLFASVIYSYRRAQRDLDLGGVQVKKGQWVALMLAGAGRDPAHYPNPYEVDLNRRSPRDHFGLNMGVRTCAGQSLARYQLERVLAAAIQRLPNLRPDRDAEPPRYVGDRVRWWEPLHALFDAPTT